MAVIAADDQPKASAAKPPISTHPAFPAIVALWFAALFGFGSLILPVVLLEKLVSMTGLAAIVPAAAPPLGFTARALVALAGSGSGAVIGALLARAVARAHRENAGSPPRGRAAINPREELGEAMLVSEPAAPLSRRRKLALYSEQEPAEDYPMEEPLPSGDHAFEAEDVPSFAEKPAPAFADEENDEAEDGDYAEPLQWTEFEEDAADSWPEPALAEEPADTGFAPADSAEPEWPAAPAPRAAEAPARNAGAAQPALADLGLVQLVERLGSALSEYRAHLRERDRPVAPAAGLAIAPADADVAAEARAAYFSDPQPMAAVGDMADYEEITEQEASRDSLAARLTPLGGPPAFASDDEFGDDEGDAPYASLLQQDYDSDFADFDLSHDAQDEGGIEDMAFPQAANDAQEAGARSDDLAEHRRRRFDPPTQGPNAADATGSIRPPEADEALRTALAALQRINGAA